MVAMDLFAPVRELFGGGTLTLWLLVGGVLLLLIAVKVAKLFVKVFFIAVAFALFFGTFPWSGESVTGPVAVCALNTTAGEIAGFDQHLVKRITVKSVSDDANCNGDNSGLASGTAVVQFRSFFDVPIRSFDVTPQGATEQP